MQLSSADTRLAPANFPHQLLDLVITLLQGRFGADLLVVRLPAYTNEFACLGETQARYLFCSMSRLKALLAA